jgi:hypothetical protein
VLGEGLRPDTTQRLPRLLPLLADLETFKLADLLGSAGATIGIIIAGVVFLQFLSARSNDVTIRYRSLAGEYRGPETGADRHNTLQEQLACYRLRLHLLLWASWFGAGALLRFLTAVAATGLSVVWMEVNAFRVLGAVAMFVGLAVMAVAVLVELVESIQSRSELGKEVADLDPAAGGRHREGRAVP